MGSGSKRTRTLHSAARFARNYVKQHGLLYWKHPDLPKFKVLFRVFLTHQGIQNSHLTNRELSRLVADLWRDRDFEKFGMNWDVGFYSSREWLNLRREVFKKYGMVCMKCGESSHIAVDHIKPKSIFPDLKMDPDNMQVLCRSCNSAKSNRRIVDYRGQQVASVADRLSDATMASSV